MYVPEEKIFPETAYRERFRSFREQPGKPCGIGCAYNCCDPLITSVILLRDKVSGALSESVKSAGDDLRRDIEGNENVLNLKGYFIAPSFFRSCFEHGPDFGIKSDQKGYIQIYILFGCPNLTLAGLCAIYGAQRFGICEDFKGCPEYRISAEMTESSFVVLAFHYWLMRRLIIRYSMADPEQAILTWKTNESRGIRFFLRNENAYTDLMYSKDGDL